MNKACHHDRLFNWKLFKHVDILAKTLWVQRYGDSPTFAIPKTWDFYSFAASHLLVLFFIGNCFIIVILCATNTTTQTICIL